MLRASAGSRVFSTNRSLKLDYAMKTVTLSQNVGARTDLGAIFDDGEEKILTWY